MALRILWEQDEALILLDALLRVLNEGYPRNQAIEEVSTTLRRRAIAKGIEIDDIFRNTNGIDMQFNSMMYVLTDSEKGLKCSSKVFRQAVDLYKNNRTEYENLLKEKKQHLNSHIWNGYPRKLLRKNFQIFIFCIPI